MQRPQFQDDTFQALLTIDAHDPAFQDKFMAVTYAPGKAHRVIHSIAFANAAAATNSNGDFQIVQASRMVKGGFTGFVPLLSSRFDAYCAIVFYLMTSDEPLQCGATYLRDQQVVLNVECWLIHFVRLFKRLMQDAAALGQLTDGFHPATDRHLTAARSVYEVLNTFDGKLVLSPGGCRETRDVADNLFAMGVICKLTYGDLWVMWYQFVGCVCGNHDPMAKGLTEEITGVCPWFPNVCPWRDEPGAAQYVSNIADKQIRNALKEARDKIVKLRLNQHGCRSTNHGVGS
jgi:hypothetical protein